MTLPPDFLNKRIIYPNGIGGVSIVIPSAECQTMSDWIKAVPEGVSYQIVDVEDIPDDRTYRDAWTYEE